MNQQEVVAIGYVVEEDDKVTPVSGTPMATTQSSLSLLEEKDELTKSMETHRSSISHHEKMTDRLWEDSARLREKQSVLKAKLKA